jgi:hypothetical protein
MRQVASYAHDKLSSPRAGHSHSTTSSTFGGVVLDKRAVQSKHHAVKDVNSSTIGTVFVMIHNYVRLERAIGESQCAVAPCIDSSWRSAADMTTARGHRVRDVNLTGCELRVEAPRFVAAADTGFIHN